VRFAVWLAERVAVGARGDEVTEAFLDESDRADAAFILPAEYLVCSFVDSRKTRVTVCTVILKITFINIAVV